MTTQEKKRKMTTNRVDFDQICRILKVDTWEQRDDRIFESYGWDADASEEENLATEEESRDEAFRAYHDAVMSVTEEAFAEHGLMLEGVPFGRSPVAHPWYFRILPKHDWKDAASHIRETIDGFGLFVFGSLRNFLASGPYTPREAVLNHIGWIPDWYRVYGNGTASYHVERKMR